jgi:hypothetical protein
VRLSVFPEGGCRLPESLRDIPQCEIWIRESGIFLRESEKDLPEAVIRIREGEKVIRESGIHLPESLKDLPLMKFCPSGLLAGRAAMDRGAHCAPPSTPGSTHGEPRSHGVDPFRFDVSAHYACHKGSSALFTALIAFFTEQEKTSLLTLMRPAFSNVRVTLCSRNVFCAASSTWPPREHLTK